MENPPSQHMLGSAAELVTKVDRRAFLMESALDGRKGVHYFRGRRLSVICGLVLALWIAATAAATASWLPRFLPPHSLLVVAPHCDDETLGAGGLICGAVRAGSRVRVVILTDGDAFRGGAARWFHKRPAEIRPVDMRRYGALRRRESLAALRRLGLPRRDVVFLGYPDQGLTPLWSGAGSLAHPYRSPATGRDHDSSGQPYCAHSLRMELTRQITQDRPDCVVVTPPSDAHPDHVAAGWFVGAVVDRLPRSRRPHLAYYLIHRDGWPARAGLFPDAPLEPPPGVAPGFWATLPLDPLEARAKADAVRAYKTQALMMGPFLNSFVRRNEVFLVPAPAAP